RLDVARLQRVPTLVGMVRPDTGEAVSLQFNPHLDAIRFRAVADPTLRFLRLRQDTEQILHVVSDLVRDHIGFGKFAGLAAAPTEANLHVAAERGIEIDTPVVRAVERTHRRLRESATALNRSGVQAQSRDA